ncbi:MAG: hypothetical protein HC892_12700 [Saprospiraceae bacterium]|nr:hypothetical protein [Saprospiraceae bacterium]
MWEGYFHAIIYLVMSYINVYVQAEVLHHKGRLDLIAQTDDYLYLMEFKLDGRVEDALEQIKQRAYFMPYRNSDKIIFLVGINFSKEERNVDSWEAQRWQAS